MTDIVDRLIRQYNEWNNPPSPELPEGAGILLEAKAEVERLRAALREIADLRYECGDSECGAEHIAREALEEGKDE